MDLCDLHNRYYLQAAIDINRDKSEREREKGGWYEGKRKKGKRGTGDEKETKIKREQKRKGEKRK